MTGPVEGIAAAYEPFVSALLAGEGGAADAEGWTAELVAAHVALNNECFTAAARAVLPGATPVYDNAIAVDAGELAIHVARLGDRTAVAEWVRRSARELDALYESMTDEQRATQMHTRIRDGGTVVVDEPRGVGRMIEGNATYHLQQHLEQLRSLARRP